MAGYRYAARGRVGFGAGRSAAVDSLNAGVMVRAHHVPVIVVMHAVAEREWRDGGDKNDHGYEYSTHADNVGTGPAEVKRSVASASVRDPFAAV
jgi:hypothetical protein